jgi:Flp pilus assembly secretin CpaC
MPSLRASSGLNQAETYQADGNKIPANASTNTQTTVLSLNQYKQYLFKNTAEC